MYKITYKDENREGITDRQPDRNTKFYGQRSFQYASGQFQANMDMTKKIKYLSQLSFDSKVKANI